MRRMIVRAVLVLAAVGAGALALSGTASATHVKAEIAGPDGADVGRTTEVQAALHFVDDGQPAANVPVTFYVATSFGGVDGEVELGQAVTDEDGVAKLGYEPRIGGEHTIRMEYATGDTGETESATTSMSVGGGEQLYRSTAGVDIPGLHVWLLMVVVGAVWAILLSVAARVIVIARAGSSQEGNA